MRAIVAVLLLCTAAAAGCSTPEVKPGYVEIAAAVIGAPDAMPEPAGPVVMRVDGAISKASNGDVLELDLPTIEQMGLVRYSVHDPWLDEDLEMTGILLSAFLDAIGVAPDATTLTIRAVDDYQIDLPIEVVRRWPVMLATRTNGEPMELEDKGPTRVVFPYDQFPEIDQLAYKDLWIWQIASISVH